MLDSHQGWTTVEAIRRLHSLRMAVPGVNECNGDITLAISPLLQFHLNSGVIYDLAGSRLSRSSGSDPPI
jgi:hypothetical protein